MGCRLIGRWRIVAADLCESDSSTSADPLCQADPLDLAYGYSGRLFCWARFAEMDEVSGSGSAEILEDGSLLTDLSAIAATRPSSKPNARLSSSACQRPELSTGRGSSPLRPGILPRNQ
jgi:hypothetical protein